MASAGASALPLALTTLLLLLCSTAFADFEPLVSSVAAAPAHPPTSHHHHHTHAPAPSPHPHHHHHPHPHRTHAPTPSPTTHAPAHSPLHAPTPSHSHSPAPAPAKHHHHHHAPAPAPHHAVAPVSPPAAAPSPANAHPPRRFPFQRLLVAVQGVVYCKPCKYSGVDTLSGATPVLGATVKLTCNNSHVPQVFNATTDKNGYFRVKAPKTITNYGVHKCHGVLDSTPDKACAVKSNLHGGSTGGYLRVDKKFVELNQTYVLFTVGPFAFEQPKCH